jgi:hypothetical protein
MERGSDFVPKYRQVGSVQRVICEHGGLYLKGKTAYTPGRRYFRRCLMPPPFAPRVRLVKYPLKIIGEPSCEGETEPVRYVEIWSDCDSGYNSNLARTVMLLMSTLDRGGERPYDP